MPEGNGGSFKDEGGGEERLGSCVREALLKQTGSIVRGEKKVGEVHQQRVPFALYLLPSRAL